MRGPRCGGAAAVLLIFLAGNAADRLGAGAPTAVGWLLLALIAGVLLFGLHRVARAWDGFADRVVESMHFGDIGRDRLLVMRSPGDEASSTQTQKYRNMKKPMDSRRWLGAKRSDTRRYRKHLLVTSSA